MEIDSSFLTRSCCCSVEWLILIAIRLNMSSCTTMMTEILLFLFGLLSISLLSPRVLNLFLIKFTRCI